MNKIMGYVYSFLSFLFPKVKENIIKNIILFGSAVRDELGEDSDIDLFIELYSKNKRSK